MTSYEGNTAMVLIGCRLENNPLPLKAMVAATEGFIQPSESLPRLTAWSSRNPSAANERLDLQASDRPQPGGPANGKAGAEQSLNAAFHLQNMFCVRLNKESCASHCDAVHHRLSPRGGRLRTLQPEYDPFDADQHKDARAAHRLAREAIHDHVAGRDRRAGRLERAV